MSLVLSCTTLSYFLINTLTFFHFHPFKAKLGFTHRSSIPTQHSVNVTINRRQTNLALLTKQA